jgi:hypothetical protein
MQVDIFYPHQIYFIIFINHAFSSLKELCSSEIVPGDDECTCCLSFAIIGWSLLLRPLRVCVFSMHDFQLSAKMRKHCLCDAIRLLILFTTILRRRQTAKLYFYVNFIAQKCLLGKGSRHMNVCFHDDDDETLYLIWSGNFASVCRIDRYLVSFICCARHQIICGHSVDIFTSREIPGANLYYRLSLPQNHVTAGRIRWIDNRITSSGIESATCSIAVKISVHFKIQHIIISLWPPLWSSGQSSWLQIRRPGFDSRHYQKKK